MRNLLVFLLLALPIAAEEALTNADVVKLVKAGLSAETIEAKIATAATNFDTSTDALVALAGEGVPDRVIRAMIGREPDGRPIPMSIQGRPEPDAEPTRPAAPAIPSRRYDIAIHADKYAKCDGAELRVDSHGLKATGCNKLNFDLTWAAIKRVCHDYGFRGTIVITTEKGEHRISTITPAEAKKIVEHVGKRMATAKCATE